MGNKRRMGHIGFQSSEIAFIEDEMAAIAAEYGLAIDADVAQHVHQRQDAKKARRKQPQPKISGGGNDSSAPVPAKRPRVVLHALPSRFRHDTSLADVNEHGEVLDMLRDVLPEYGTLAQCGVPGCSCRHGGREIVLDARVKKEHHSMATVDALRAGQCKRCQHGVLQHAIIVRDDGDSSSSASSKPSGGQRLFSALFQLIRLARVAGTIYSSRVWSQSATELLDALLQHVTAQFATGGTQNGQKTLAELHHEQQVVRALETQLKKATRATGASTRDEMPIRLACVYDDMYFQCYYASIVLYGRACGAVPAPDAYFRDLEHFCPAAQPQLEAFVNTELVVGDTDSSDDTSVVDALALPVRANKKPADVPVLLDIFHARLREGVRLFYEQSVGMHGEMDALLVNPHLIASAQAAVASKKKKKPQKKHYRRERGKTGASNSVGDSSATTTAITTNNNGLVELPAYALLAQWRNNCRDWCCHLYAYATPTSEALTVVGEYAPLVEMGAGTGYWSSLLQARHVDIVAYDKCPPTTDGATGPRAHRQERNAYHGQVPPFCAIGKGGPEVLTQTTPSSDMAARNLLLCYPPPHDDMALNCVRSFQGEFVIHIGEWQGDTGDRRFEKELHVRFALVRELALPNWGNSAYHLSVWRRKRTTPFKQVPCTALSCFTCRKSLDDAVDEGEPLKRCMLCKTNVYCSAFCEERGRKTHSAEHAKRLVFLENDSDLEFENELHYAPLVAVAELDTAEADKVVKIQKSWKELTGADGDNDHDHDNDTGDSDGDSIDDEDDAAHASGDDDSDMKDSDMDDEDSDEQSEEEEDDDDNDSEQEQRRAPPAKKLRPSETKPAAVSQPKPKTTGFAFNFKA